MWDSLTFSSRLMLRTTACGLGRLALADSRLTFNQFGRDFRLTDVHGSVVKEILA